MIGESEQQADERFMRAAIEEGREAERNGEVPVGAVVVCNGTIIAKAHNLTQRLNDVTAHAEMQAITAAADYLGGKYLTDCTLYVTVEPCAMCAGALGWSQISRIVYGTPDAKRGFLSYYLEGGKPGMRSPLHPKTLLTQGVCADECAELMREFFRKHR